MRYINSMGTLELLNTSNFNQGFLVDEELMAGITSEGTSFVAFVLRHTTGEYLGYEKFESLSDALSKINGIPRAWTFEAAGGCGSCADGKCSVEKGGSCRKQSEPCEPGSCAPTP